MDSSQLMLRKKEVAVVVNSRGWYFMKQMAEEAVAELVNQAIEEEDDAKGAALRLQAKAARAFANDFLKRIEASTRVEVAETSTDAAQDVYDVACD